MKSSCVEMRGMEVCRIKQRVGKTKRMRGEGTKRKGLAQVGASIWAVYDKQWVVYAGRIWVRFRKDKGRMLG